MPTKYYDNIVMLTLLISTHLENHHRWFENVIKGVLIEMFDKCISLPEIRSINCD